ncbi:hypothetical protein [Streptomyces boncukensis]|uniref:Uncharacterized protein n=1 Tax=Streptomyces boncukensis TaxID=2711219 RepID=A0A6G4WZX0_9ACTN|nr:hypothetical protein [Streptomyces boncukensis]NGO70836.1 hypothetical protein [Streptomyces boncukensis]
MTDDPALNPTHRGLRVSRVPGKSVHRDPHGRYAIPLWLQRDVRFDTDLTLQLTPAEAELLHAQLCFALDAVPEPVTTSPEQTPDCRNPQHGRTEVRWP